MTPLKMLMLVSCTFVCRTGVAMSLVISKSKVAPQATDDSTT